jgi:hypothetical protein
MASVSNEQFLSVCIKHMEGKVSSVGLQEISCVVPNPDQINFKEVAKETGLKESAV